MMSWYRMRMARTRMGKTVAFDDQIMAFLVDHYPYAYTPGEIAGEFAAAGMKMPNWAWCDGGETCRAESESLAGYTHEAADYYGAPHGRDVWTYTPYGQDVSPRLAWLRKKGLVVCVPGINGGYNHWHAEPDAAITEKAALEALDLLFLET